MKIVAFLSLFFITQSLLAIKEYDPDSALIVIDMQDQFSVSKSTVKYIRELMEVYKNHNRNIILVEFGSTKTRKELLDVVVGYDHLFTVTKGQMDGSKEVTELFQQKNLTPSQIKVVGVNTCCCVKTTVQGLAKKILFKKKIDVDAKGCHCHAHFCDAFPSKSLKCKVVFGCIKRDKTFQELSSLKDVKIVNYKKEVFRRPITAKRIRFKPDFPSHFNLIMTKFRLNFLLNGTAELRSDDIVGLGEGLDKWYEYNCSLN